MDTDSVWRKYGAEDPYYGVLTDGRFRRGARGSNLDAFFQSGEEHIDKIMAVIRDQFDSSYSPRRAIDFGCGVGRVLIPMARRVPEVIGIDISEGMLSEARRNCDQRNIRNVEMVISSDELAGINGQFDLIHSYICLQHIAPGRGSEFVRKLVSRLSDGGVAVLHVTFAFDGPSWKRIVYALRKKIPPVHWLVNMLAGHKWSQPVMQMSNYSLPKVFMLLEGLGCHRVVTRVTNHGGYVGLILFAQRGARREQF